MTGASKVALLVAAVVLVAQFGRARSQPVESNDAAIQFLADVTAIDAECEDVNAMFGLAFDYAASRDIDVVDLMPVGKRRAEFMAAYRRTTEQMSRDEICGSLRRRRENELPGLFVPR